MNNHQRGTWGRLQPGRIRAVLFDMDDTLVTWADVPGNWEQTIGPYLRRVYSYLLSCGHALPDEESFCRSVHDHMERGWVEASETLIAPSMPQEWRAALETLGLDTSAIDVDEVLRAYEWGPVKGLALYPDTIEVLDALREAGYKIGLVTNSSMPMWMRDLELEAFGLIDYFDARVTSGDARYLKPHPAIYRRILDLLDLKPAQALFVGDSPAHDIAGANEAGLISVLIDPPHLERARNGVAPDFVITRLSELLPILTQLEGHRTTETQRSQRELR